MVIEAAIHTAKTAFETEKSEGALLVDAIIEFNSLNGQVTLRNIRRLCLLLATILSNTY